MDPDLARIQDDLAGLLEGQIRCDDTFLQLYSSDASLYEVKPMGVVRPAGTADVVACVNYARENDLTIVPRGAGSNVLGASIGNGLILDFSYSMRQVLAVDRDTVRVQPGLILGDLNQHLASHGKMFGPDPSTRNISTVGGLLSLNRSGSRWLKTGTPREHVVSIEMVLASGEVVQFDSRLGQQVNPDLQNVQKSFESTQYEGRIKTIIDRNTQLIADSQPKVKINQAGYHVYDVVDGDEVDLTRLLVGSEGTLGVITEVTLRTIPIPRHRGAILLFFHRLESAASAAVDIADAGVVACDLMDRRLLRLASEKDARYANLIPDEAEAMLLVEFEANDDGELRKKIDGLVQRVVRRKKWAFDHRSATQQQQRDFFWKMARRVVPTLYRMQGNRRAVPFVEDMGVDPKRLPEFLKEVHSVLNHNEVTASVFSHTPQGTVHVRPFVTIGNREHIAKMHRVATDLYEKVIDFDGTISASEGDGMSRTWFLRRQFGKLHSVFSEIKNVFDPQNIFNNGKIVGGPHMGLTDNLRSVNVALVAPPKGDDAARKTAKDEEEPDANALPTITSGAGKPNRKKVSKFKARRQARQAKAKAQRELAVSEASASDKGAESGTLSALPVLAPELNWTIPELAFAAQSCNGCGRCRTTIKSERMCPVFRLAPREEASPRAKANLFRGVVTGNLSPEMLATDEFKGVADLCVNCHQCRFECPAKVNIPKLMVEAKAQYLAVNGMKLSDWILTRLDLLYQFGGRMPWLTNRILRSRTSRWVMDRVLGIAQGRKLPMFHTGTFLKWAQRQKLHIASKQATRKVVFFVDAFVNWNDVELGMAFCHVLQHNNVEVLVPPGQSMSGMSLVSEGAVDRAKKVAARNVELLADLVRQGYQVVTTEPSAALAIKQEYLNLLDEEDANLVAQNTTDASNFLYALHQAGELQLDFRPVNETIGYHLPCHQRALNHDESQGVVPDEQIPGVKILELIPALQVETIRKGCSGMAGTYGIKRKNYLRSLRMGVQLIQAIRAPAIVAGATECSSCKIQMEQGTSKPTIHPVKILAHAYGLMPQLEDLFNRKSGELTIS